MNNELQENIARINEKYCQLRNYQYGIYTRRAKEQGITVYTLFMFEYMYNKNSCFTQVEISNATSISKQTVSASVKCLLRDGYLCYADDGNGGKSKKYMELTEKGREFAKETITPVHDAEIDAMSTISPALWDMLLETTEQYVAMLKETEQKIKTA